MTWEIDGRIRQKVAGVWACQERGRGEMWKTVGYDRLNCKKICCARQLCGAYGESKKTSERSRRREEQCSMASMVEVGEEVTLSQARWRRVIQS